MKIIEKEAKLIKPSAWDITEKKERSVIDCIEDAKTAKFALYLIYGLLSGKRTLNQTFPFPLHEFNDDDMNGIFESIIDIFLEREKENEEEK